MSYQWFVIILIEDVENLFIFVVRTEGWPGFDCCLLGASNEYRERFPCAGHKGWFVCGGLDIV